MGKLSVVLLLTVFAGIADAQVQPTPYGPYPPAPQPTPPPQPWQPPPPQPQPGPSGYGYYQPAPRPVMNVQLTVDEQWLLQRGYISDGETMAGGFVALLFGWGVGHAIQGRWSEKGYIFTLGESVTAVAAFYGMIGLFGECFEGCSDARGQRYATLFIGGMIGNAVFRIWEVIDAFSAPGAHNRRVDEVRMKVGLPLRYGSLSPYIAPNRDRDGGGIAGVSFRF